MEIRKNGWYKYIPPSQKEVNTNKIGVPDGRLEGPIETADTFEKEAPIGRRETTVDQAPQVLIELLHTFQIEFIVGTQLMKHNANSISILDARREGCQREREHQPAIKEEHKETENVRVREAKSLSRSIAV